jgi:hypothetical protein
MKMALKPNKEGGKTRKTNFSKQRIRSLKKNDRFLKLPKLSKEKSQAIRTITANTALRLARYFKMSLQICLGLQMDYELDVQQDQIADKLKQEVKIFQDLKTA